jgi:ribosome biogenesis protein Nip4
MICSYYVSEHVLKGASAIGRKELALLGTCFGKFSGTGKFRLHITCLDFLAQVCPAASRRATFAHRGAHAAPESALNQHRKPGALFLF